MLNPPNIKTEHITKRFLFFSFLFSIIILFIRWSMLGLDTMGFFSLDKYLLAFNNELLFSEKSDIRAFVKLKNSINHSS